MSSKWAKGTAGPAGPAGDEHHNLIPVPFDTTQITSASNYGSRWHNGVMQDMQVRRMTPLECERLQGFPDGHTNVPHRGKPAADGPRYKALGNSWAINCARWIGERIEQVEEITTYQSRSTAGLAFSEAV